MPNENNFTVFPNDDNLVGELYSIQSGLRAVRDLLGSQEHYGESHLIHILGESLNEVAEKMDNEDWKPTKRPPCKVHVLG